MQFRRKTGAVEEQRTIAHWVEALFAVVVHRRSCGDDAALALLASGRLGLECGEQGSNGVGLRGCVAVALESLVDGVQLGFGGVAGDKAAQWLAAALVAEHVKHVIAALVAGFVPGAGFVDSLGVGVFNRVDGALLAMSAVVVGAGAGVLVHCIRADTVVGARLAGGEGAVVVRVAALEILCMDIVSQHTPHESGKGHRVAWNGMAGERTVNAVERRSGLQGGVDRCDHARLAGAAFVFYSSFVASAVVLVQRICTPREGCQRGTQSTAREAKCAAEEVRTHAEAFVSARLAASERAFTVAVAAVGIVAVGLALERVAAQARHLALRAAAASVRRAGAGVLVHCICTGMGHSVRSCRSVD